jgi:hypothetical protein
MNDAYTKGKTYEMHIAKLIRRKADKGSMRNRSSHTNGARRADVFTNLPIHVEAKHHENVRIKEWMEQAEAAKSFSQTAVVAFRIDENDYACLNFNDLLDLFVQIADMQLEIDDLRAPIENLQTVPPVIVKSSEQVEEAIKPLVEKKKAVKSYSCRAGHISDEYGYCMQKGCKYTRGYKPPKKAKK